MTRAVEFERGIVSPWALIAASRVTVPALLAVSVGVALWAGAAPLFVGFGSLLASGGVLALAGVATAAAWRAARGFPARAAVTSVDLIVFTVVISAPLTVAALVSPAATGAAAGALPILIVLAGLSNRVPRVGLPAGRTIAALALLIVAAVATVRAVSGTLADVSAQLSAGGFTGFAALCVAVILVSVLTVILRPGRRGVTL